jgi:hypothetical protein
MKTIVMVTNTPSKPSTYSKFFASKYLNGDKYFKILSFSFRSIAIDRINVSNRTAVEKEEALFGFFKTAAKPVPISKNKSCNRNIPTMRIPTSLRIPSSPLLNLKINKIEEIKVTILSMTILNNAAASFIVMIFNRVTGFTNKNSEVLSRSSFEMMFAHNNTE